MTSSPHTVGAGPSRRDGWRALALRLTVLVLPAQVVGAFLGYLPLLLLGGRVIDLPWVSGLVLVGMGAVAGAAVGRFATPPEDERRTAVLLAGAYALAAFLVLRLLVEIRLPEGSSPSVLVWVVGAVIVVAVQSAVTTLLWRTRSAHGEL